MWRRRLKIFLLIISDIFILYATLGLTLFIRYAVIERDLPTLYSSAPLHLIPFTIIFFFWLIIFWAAGLYDIIKLRNEEAFYKTLLTAFGINAAIAITFFYFIPYFIITPKINLFIHLALGLVFLYFWRQYFNKWAKELLRIHLVFLGANSEAIELKEFLTKNPQLGYRVDDILAPDNFAELDNLWRIKKFSLIVSAEKFDHSKIALVLFEYLKRGVAISDLDRFYEDITQRVPISIIKEVWFLENISELEKGFYEKIKRFFDVALGILLGLFTLAIFPFVALGIKIFDPGPIFYKQERVGKNNRGFRLMKFRSLPIAKTADHLMQKPAEKDITAFGKFLRKSHWDELPQIWNILKSEMSFIGPRPEKPEFVAQLSKEVPFYEMRHLIKPGIAGWAQLHNPSAAPTLKETLEKLQYDLYYIKNRSVFLDLSIILKTIKILISGAGK